MARRRVLSSNASIRVDRVEWRPSHFRRLSRPGRNLLRDRPWPPSEACRLTSRFVNATMCSISSEWHDDVYNCAHAVAKLARDVRMKRLHRRLTALSILLLVTLGLATDGRAYDVAAISDTETLGFSAPRLSRIAAWQQTQVNAGAFSGAVAAIARNGRVAYMRAVGFRDRAKTTPLQLDAIFWIASMTKPVTSVAAMMLVEEGKLDLAAPVANYLPELMNMMVAVETKDPVTGKTQIAYEPQKHPMTVEDLLRQTSGLTYADSGNTAVHRLYRESGLNAKGLARDGTLKDFVSRLARLPLAHQPGEVWEYGHNADVLGRVIEVASGQPFDRFLDNRLFKPLGMVDTGFWVPPEKLARLVDPPAGATMLPDRDVTKPTTLFSGGGGLVSTAADYLRFCQMLLNGGELDGVRILSPEIVRRMTTSAVPPGKRIADGSVWGLGFSIRSEAARSSVAGSVGSFSWNGIWGTHFWVDPAEQLIAINLIHVAPNKFAVFNSAFHGLVYGAFSVPDQGVPASADAGVDQAALASFTGTYRFATLSSRDRQDEIGGLGIQIAIQDGRLEVKFPIQGTPAAKAGVMADDIITHLDGEATQGKSLDQVLDKMRGPVNSSIRLTIARKGQNEPIELTIVRAVIAPLGTDLHVAITDGKLQVEAGGALPVLDFEKGMPITLVPMSNDEFFVDSGEHTRLAFLHDEIGKATGLVLNPGPWQITGQRIN
ncbi:serine hydrolase [Bradyrhizobium sp. LLZ17]|uniref:Serine hydrolase n=1 Tax=Bradyrhizobium sp. LLZ17 TaxID=3239388 RepID=A0AB39XES5_9BRAD